MKAGLLRKGKLMELIVSFLTKISSEIIGFLKKTTEKFCDLGLVNILYLKFTFQYLLII